LPDARLKVYPDTGHSLPWERPAEVSHDIARFVESLDKARSIDR
jgi:pimeloyl-ACP methyl ester carboxylesterase